MDKKLKTRSIGRCGKKSYSGIFQENKKKHNSKFFLFFLISLFLVLFFIAYLLFSNWFNIKIIEVNGLNNINENKIKEIAYKQQEEKKLFFKQENLILFNKNKLLNTLNNFNFSSLEIEKKYFNRKIIINIQEREKSLIFKENNYFFFLDKEANIIEYQVDCQFQLSEEEKLEENDDFSDNLNENNSNCLDFNKEYKKECLYPLIENNNESRVLEDKKRVKLKPEYIDFSLKLYNDLRGEESFDFNKIILDEDYNSIKVKLNNGLDIYFSLQDDYSEQISRFFTLKKEKKLDLQAKKYIDLRYGDKIFYY